MSNQNLEVLVNTLSAQVVSQGYQIAELQKQLASMQLTSCELEVIKNAMLMAISNNSIEIKESNGATTCQLKPF
ncbi:TPA: hypothetical protein ACXNIR_003793 [Proteus mirabilis]|uniref:hypothetical protein n=1 Tax=Proteus TaxID=583 RepID=UPI0008A6090F|nr:MULTISPECIES: hypothetical protein [Proteus]EKU8115276.1 hypothetical protein [Proteus mirabilis]MBG2968135.1 hypothetical protein [Proteus mirabilis]MBG2985445.1 hypothetical protein [Proteus mirabilis]MBI6265769.1 hypothetical protein [Proteus mirabilis]MDZ7489814.1 hypothetical protein [Proteus mirabilis]